VDRADIQLFSEKVMRFILAPMVMWLAAIPSAMAADGMTSTQANDILSELRAIHQLLERQNAAPTTQAAAAAQPPVYQRVVMPMPPGAASLGAANAPLVMIEFTDYQCSFCRRFHETAFKELNNQYIATGKLRYVSRDYPLDFHDNAGRASLAGRCAADQGKFWEMRSAMIEHNDHLQPQDLTQYAATLALDPDAMNQCIDSGRYNKLIEQDESDAKSVGVSGTPSFILGRIKNGNLEGIRIVGAQPLADYKTQIERLLQDQ
jgi:protein-disulfide isomerase